MNNLHPIFADLLKPYTPLPVPNTGSALVDKSLVGLGTAVTAKQITEIGREIDRNLACCDRLVGTIQDALAEESDALTDYARDEAVRKVTAARTERQQRVERVALMLKRVQEMRADIHDEPHTLSMLIEAMGK